ncbi:MAG: YdcF family protein [Azoarcus sp.]|jgi:uncharacterized SAM-binding protein YcdF (DUF218 family)|nr:YdcF family protein [Azoarcus sp.]
MAAVVLAFMFWLKKVLSALFLPPLLLFILTFIGLILIRLRKRGGVALVWAGFILGLLASLPASVNLLLARLEPTAPLQIEEARSAQAIVILGGGRMIDAPEYGGRDTVSIYTLERLRYGARLARELGLPVLVSGGAPGGRTPEAALMKAVLEEDFNVAVRWEENVSLNTKLNAEKSAALLQGEGIQRIVLVTSAFHMRRSVAEFESRGFEVLAAPTGWLGSHHKDPVLNMLPNAGSTVTGWMALREWLGLLAQKLGLG